MSCFSKPMVSNIQVNAPVAVGGVGGSGTRLVAGILARLKFFTGNDLNQSLDNLWFTLLFKRPEIFDCSESEFQTCVDLFSSRMQGHTDFAPTDFAFLQYLGRADRPQHDSLWLEKRIRSFCAAPVERVRAQRWGWKEPNTHIVLPRLMESLPNLKYVHVMRNGLDMAYSENQNQLRLWGAKILGGDKTRIDPKHSLKYWCRTHERIISLFELFPGRGLLLNFDALCADPKPSLESLLRFIEIDPGRQCIDELAALIRPPSSIGRFRKHDSSLFDMEDLRFVADLGFPVEEPSRNLFDSSGQHSEST